MRFQKALLSLIFILIIPSGLFAQWQSAFNSLLYPRSIASGAMGEQGVAPRNATDAMQYNPAGLVFSDNFAVSYFNNPWNLIGLHTPITATTTSLKLENGAAVGFDYMYRNYGEFTYADIYGNEKGKIHFYERSIAAGYAMPINDEIAFGVQGRYAWQPIDLDNYAQHFLFSTGVLIQPNAYSKRLSIGFSLMNFSTLINYDYTTTDENGNKVTRTETAPAPAQINFGIRGAAITNDFFEFSLAFGIMKPIVKYDAAPEYKARSSFSALLTDWSDFPNDVTAQTGVGVIWHPINLGAGVSFVQEMYLGYFTVGPDELSNSFMTHGVSVGLNVKGIKATVGYAGRWHNFNADEYLTWEFPWETVQFNLSVDKNILAADYETQTSAPSPLNIILSGGYTYGDAIGKMKKASYYNTVDISLSMKNSFSVESDFYITGYSALHTAFRYSKAVQTFDIDRTSLEFPLMFIIPPRMEVDEETISLESGYRYHPIEEFHPFFIQGSLGIIRINPVIQTSPRYYYQTFDELSVGCVFPIMNTGLNLLPKVGFKTIFMKEYFNENRIGGYNQFTYGINVGYKL